MAELKTQKNDAGVEDCLNGLPDERKREDSFAIRELMRNVTGEEPAMWGRASLALEAIISENPRIEEHKYRQ